MEKIKISVVSYLNSKPFIYGLQHSELLKDIDLQLDIPSVCAQKLMDGSVDIGLIPVAVLPLLKEQYIISDYCIGATGKVASVMLYSPVPLREIETVLLDYQSRTSIALVKILANNFWKIQPQWVQATENFEDSIKGTTAAVIIGDRTFGLELQYPFSYDLAEEWKKFTHLPFVFACWVSNKNLPDDFKQEFNQALKYGIDNIGLLIQNLERNQTYSTNIETYLRKNLSYDFNVEKEQGLKLFLDYLTRRAK